MKYVNELLKYPKHIPSNHVYMFTGNQVITKEGKLVMGGGNALACQLAYPDIPRRMAVMISTLEYPLNVYLDKHDGLVGCMFTKKHWKDPSPLDMVVAAIEDLSNTATRIGKDFTFHLPYPAIGLGGLSREQLDEHVEKLPDNVFVYYK